VKREFLKSRNQIIHIIIFIIYNKNKNCPPSTEMAAPESTSGFASDLTSASSGECALDDLVMLHASTVDGFGDGGDDDDRRYKFWVMCIILEIDIVFDKLAQAPFLLEQLLERVSDDTQLAWLVKAIAKKMPSLAPKLVEYAPRLVGIRTAYSRAAIVELVVCGALEVTGANLSDLLADDINLENAAFLRAVSAFKSIDAEPEMIVKLFTVPAALPILLRVLLEHPNARAIAKYSLDALWCEHARPLWAVLPHSLLDKLHLTAAMVLYEGRALEEEGSLCMAMADVRDATISEFDRIWIAAACRIGGVFPLFTLECDYCARKALRNALISSTLRTSSVFVLALASYTFPAYDDDELFDALMPYLHHAQQEVRAAAEKTMTSMMGSYGNDAAAFHNQMLTARRAR